MSADEHLNKQQFMSVAHLAANVGSSDFGDKVGDMKGRWLADAQKEPQERHTEHGGPQGYVDHLATSIKKHGVQKPLTVVDYHFEGEEPGQTLYDGHHRALAAMQAGLHEVPVNHTTYAKFFGF